MLPQKDKRRFYVAALALVVLHVVVRLWNLGRENLWLDEHVSVVDSSQSFASIIRMSFYQNSLPLYSLFLKAWRILSGPQLSPFWLRLPSVVFSTLAFVEFLKIGARVVGENPRWLLWAFLFSWHPVSIEWGQWARSYALLSYLVLVNLGAAFEIQSDGTKARHLFVFMLSGLLATLTHYFGLLWWTLSMLFLATDRAIKRDRKPLLVLLSLAAFVVTFSPWGHKVVTRFFSNESFWTQQMGDEWFFHQFKMLLGGSWVSMFALLALGWTSWFFRRSSKSAVEEPSARLKILRRVCSGLVFLNVGVIAIKSIYYTPIIVAQYFDHLIGPIFLGLVFVPRSECRVARRMTTALMILVAIGYGPSVRWIFLRSAGPTLADALKSSLEHSPAMDEIPLIGENFRFDYNPFQYAFVRHPEIPIHRFQYWPFTQRKPFDCNKEYTLVVNLNPAHYESLLKSLKSCHRVQRVGPENLLSYTRLATLRLWVD